MHGHQLLLASVLLLASAFHALLPLYPSTKQRSWILTALGSAVLTIASAPFLVDFLSKGGDIVQLVQVRWWSESACRIFQAYLISYAPHSSVPSMILIPPIALVEIWLWARYTTATE